MIILGIETPVVEPLGIGSLRGTQSATTKKISEENL